MRHENSVMHGVLKQVPWWVFDRLVTAHAADKGVRRLSTKRQLVALLYSQLAGAGSLRAIELGLSSHAARLYHLGGGTVARSTLADANALRPAAVFEGLLEHLIARAHPSLRRKLQAPLRLIDATPLRLGVRSLDWARFSARACGAKAHVVYDPDADCPLYLAITPARINDITVAKRMPIEAGATYVFDLAYYDYGFWAALHAKGCRIVTRLKRNTPLADVRERRLPKGSALLSDRTGTLPARQAASRTNPFQARVREIRVRTDTGKVLRILTNDLRSSAQAIADLYRRRWAVELFFRWIKQTLRIRHLIGTSENAVRIQIAVALIAFVLLRLASRALPAVRSPLAFARLVQANLFHKRDLANLLTPQPPPIHDPRQLTLVLQAQ